MSSPVTVSAGLAVELYFVRQALDTYSQHGRTRKTILATLSILEACLQEALELTLVSVDPQLWYPIQHYEENKGPWPNLAATIADPKSDRIVAEAAFVELGYRLRFLAAKLEGKYKWNVFDDPSNQILFGFKVNFGQNGRVHIKIGGQWSVRVWEIDLNEDFSEMAGIREQLSFVESRYEMIDGSIIGDRETPFSISLNWLTDGADIDSIDSFDVVGPDIRKTLSLQHEIYGEEDRILTERELARRIGERKESLIINSRSRERDREDTTRGILITNDEEVQIAKMDLRLRRNLYEQKRKAEREERRRAERERQQLNRIPLP